MSLYALAQRTTTTTVNTPLWEVRSGAKDVHIVELALTQATAPGVAGAYGLGRPQALGVTPTAPQSFVAEDDAGAPTSLSSAAVAWGTAPVQPASMFRRASTTTSIGAGCIWTFPKGLELAASTSFVIWANNVPVVSDVWAVIWE